jgi:uroporphyrinogen-III synthase
VTTDPALPLLLLTRPRPQSERFAAGARAECPPHEALIAPLTEIVALPVDPAALAGASLVFTSVNGVAAVAQMPGLSRHTAWCVGPATAAAARAAGFSVWQSGGDAAHLLADLRAARPAGPLIHVRGRHVACDLALALEREGVPMRAVIAYEARSRAWEAGVIPALAAARRVVAPLFSPRAAEEFARRLGRTRPKDLRIVAISRACAARLPKDLRARATVAERPDGEAMTQAVTAALAQAQTKP